MTWFMVLCVPDLLGLEAHDLREWDRASACSELTGWKPVPLRVMGYPLPHYAASPGTSHRPGHSVHETKNSARYPDRRRVLAVGAEDQITQEILSIWPERKDVNMRLSNTLDKLRASAGLMQSFFQFKMPGTKSIWPSN